MTFSSPSGDGLVLHETHFGQAINGAEFSSPSGDGLVQQLRHRGYDAIVPFSSPSGDGLVPQTNRSLDNSSSYFRPRLGMGWFLFFPI